MSETIRKQINYTVVCVNQFARIKALHPRAAFLYLYRYKGIDFLKENYDIEHTLSLDDTIEDLDIICRNNGGELKCDYITAQKWQHGLLGFMGEAMYYLFLF